MRDDQILLNFEPRQARILKQATKAARPVYGPQMSYTHFRTWLVRWAIEMVCAAIVEEGPQAIEGRVISPQQITLKEFRHHQEPSEQPTVIDRLPVIYAELSKGGFRSVKAISRRTRTDPDTITQDVDFIRHKLLWPIQTTTRAVALTIPQTERSAEPCHA